jgi:hypothetical protein
VPVMMRRSRATGPGLKGVVATMPAALGLLSCGYVADALAERLAGREVRCDFLKLDQ